MTARPLSTAQVMNRRLEWAERMVHYDDAGARGSLEHELFAAPVASDEQVMSMFSEWRQRSIPVHPLAELELALQQSSPSAKGGKPHASRSARHQKGGGGAPLGQCSPNAGSAYFSSHGVTSIDEQIAKTLELIRGGSTSRSESMNPSDEGAGDKMSTDDQTPQEYPLVQSMVVSDDDARSVSSRKQALAPPRGAKSRRHTKSLRGHYGMRKQLSPSPSAPPIESAHTPVASCAPLLIGKLHTEFGTVVTERWERKRRQTENRSSAADLDAFCGGTELHILREVSSLRKDDDVHTAPFEKYGIERIDYFVRRPQPAAAADPLYGASAFQATESSRPLTPRTRVSPRQESIGNATNSAILPDWLPTMGCDEGEHLIADSSPLAENAATVSQPATLVDVSSAALRQLVTRVSNQLRVAKTSKARSPPTPRRSSTPRGTAQ